MSGAKGRRRGSATGTAGSRAPDRSAPSALQRMPVGASGDAQTKIKIKDGQGLAESKKNERNIVRRRCKSRHSREELV